MVSVVTKEFVGTIHTDAPPFSLIEQRGLASRLIRELEGALGELARDPRGFVHGLVLADTKDAKRRQRIYLGFAFGLAFHIALISFIAVLGWRAMRATPDSNQRVVEWITPPVFRSIEETGAPKPDMPKGGDAAGGGGGGQLAALPPSKGLPPPPSTLPQIVNMNPSNIQEPSLPVSATVVGPASEPPPPAPIGDPTGKSGNFSAGPGEKGGIGRGEGTGVGGGKDAGTGPGSKGSKGGNDAGVPDGSRTDIPGAINFTEAGSIPGYRPWTWIHRQTPVITREAQDNKVIGTVLLRATFNADGTITDITVAMAVDYMNESAEEALRRSTFHPATIRGVPVTVRNVLIRVAVHY